MDIKKIKLNHKTSGYNVCIGRLGEYKVRKVVFDVSEFVSMFGDGRAELLYRLPYGSTSSVVAMTRTGNEYEWVIGLNQTQKAGTGVATINWYVGSDKLAKSAEISCRVLDSANATIGTIPDAVQTWLDSLESDVAEKVSDAVEDYFEEHPFSGDTDTDTTYQFSFVSTQNGTYLKASWSEKNKKTGLPVTFGEDMIPVPGMGTYVSHDAMNTAISNATSTKQDIITDLDEIRSGASAGATAYQKPADGIPASDLADGVIPDDAFFVKFTVGEAISNTSSSVTSDKTFAEIKSAVDANNVVIGYIDSYNSTLEMSNRIFFRLAGSYYDESKFEFSAIYNSGLTLSMSRILIDSESATMFSTSINMNHLAYKTEIPTDTHINSLIDAKLTPLETLADEILEVM